MPHIASLLDTSLVKKVVNFMTWKLRNFSSIMMLNFVRPFFIFSISTPPTPNFVLSHFPPNIPNSWAFLEPFSTNIPSSQPQQQELSNTHEPTSPIHTHVVLEISTPPNRPPPCLLHLHLKLTSWYLLHTLETLLLLPFQPCDSPFILNNL